MKEWAQNNKKLVWGLGMFFTVIMIGLIVGAGYKLYLSQSTKNLVLLAEIDIEDEEVNIYLLPFGKDEQEAQLIARKIVPAELLMAYRKDGQINQIGQPILNFGGFLPNTQSLYYWYQEDDEIAINKLQTMNEEPVAIYQDNAQELAGYILDENGKILIKEKQDNSDMRCYLYTEEDLNRISKGTDCVLSKDWQHVLVLDQNKDAEVSASVMDVNGENEISVIEDEAGVSTAQIAADGSMVAFIQQSKDTYKVVSESTETGRVNFESDDFINISILSFAESGNNLYFVGEDEEGLLTLYFVADGVASKVDSGYAAVAAFNQTGTTLVYLVKDEDGEMRLGAYSPDGVKEKEIIQAENLSFQILQDPERILSVQTEDDELTILSISMDGAQSLELFNDQDISLENAYYLPGENKLYLTLGDEDGMYLYVTPLDAEDSGFMLVEEWYGIYLLNRAPAGNSVLWMGTEEDGDDLGLYLSTIEEKSRTDTLDDDDIMAVVNAIFDPKQETVIYSILTGENLDETEVRQMNIDGKGRPEILYPDNILIDVNWDNIAPFANLADNISGKGQISWYQPLRGVTYCPGSERLEVGSSDQGKLVTDQTTCYLVELDAETPYTFEAESETDTRLDLYTSNGSHLASDDDGGAGANPSLRTQVTESGRYYIVLGPLGETNKPYSISLMEGIGDPAFDNATFLPEGSTLSGQITSSSRVNFELIDVSIYGAVYYFDGSAGDLITIDVFAPSIGSKVDPVVYLYDAKAIALASDDDGGEGYDSKLTYTLPSDGRYYVVVKSLSDHYGRASDYYYRVLLTIR